MVIDILAGAALVFFSNGLTSPYILALFLAIIASAVRFGLYFSLLCAVVVAFIYLFVGGTAPNLQDLTVHPQLGLEWDAELPDDEDVERCSQRLRHLVRHRDAAAREAEDERRGGPQT